MTGSPAALTTALAVEKIVYPGRSLGRIEGKAVFTDRGIPGETVEIEVLRTHPGFDEARTVRVLVPSPDRVPPRCAHWPACSPYQEIAYPRQVEIKRDQVRELLGRALRLDPEKVEAVPSPKEWGYRNRLKLKVVGRGAATRLAYHEPGTEDRYVPVDRCWLVSDAAAGLFEAVLEALRSRGPESIESVEVRESATTGDLLLVLHAASPRGLETVPGWLDGVREGRPLRGTVAVVRTRRGVSEVEIGGRPWVEEELGGLRFRVGPRSFFQANVPMAAEALRRMRERLAAAGEVRVADLYAGIGAFGLALARGASEVFAVEPDEANLEGLRGAMERNGAGNVAVCAGTAEEWTEDLAARGLGAALLDPPRKGISLEVAAGLRASPPDLVFYLSCNPATLARDLASLAGTYAVEAAAMLDFFPQTAHVETLAILAKR